MIQYIITIERDEFDPEFTEKLGKFMSEQFESEDDYSVEAMDKWYYKMNNDD